MRKLAWVLPILLLTVSSSAFGEEFVYRMQYTIGHRFPDPTQDDGQRFITDTADLVAITTPTNAAAGISGFESLTGTWTSDGNIHKVSEFRPDSDVIWNEHDPNGPSRPFDYDVYFKTEDGFTVTFNWGPVGEENVFGPGGYSLGLHDLAGIGSIEYLGSVSTSTPEPSSGVTVIAVAGVWLAGAARKARPKV